MNARLRGDADHHQDILRILRCRAGVHLEKRYGRDAGRNTAADLRFEVAVFGRRGSRQSLAVVTHANNEQATVRIGERDDIRALLVWLPYLLEIEAKLFFDAALRELDDGLLQVGRNRGRQVVREEVFNRHVLIISRTMEPKYAGRRYVASTPAPAHPSLPTWLNYALLADLVQRRVP